LMGNEMEIEQGHGQPQLVRGSAFGTSGCRKDIDTASSTCRGRR
jgi:hypothetical protein